MAGSSDIPRDATVRGGNILSMLAAMGPFRRRGETILEENGLTEVNAEGWYPLAAYVRALDAIQERMGPNTLYQIGRQIPRHVVLPPGIDSFEKVLASFGQAFDLNHRGWPEGAIAYRAHSERSGTVVSATPYPCEFDRGVIQGFFQLLLGTRVNVEHNPREGCKSEGGACCTHRVSLPVL